jgi:RNA recognition motif-containing protein
MKLYVGNLDRSVTAEDLKEAFQVFGELGEVTIIRDRGNNVSKGFGFVEMPKKEEAQAAITALHGKEFKGRTMDLTEARPKTQNTSHGGFHGGGNRRGGFGGGGGGGRRY